MRKYTEQERDFLKGYIPGHTYKEIAAAFNQKFDPPITVSKVKAYMANHKMKNGLSGRFQKGHIPANKGTHPPSVGRMAETQFKKGHLPHNTKPIGYERVNRDGYIEVKIRMRPDRKTGKKNFAPKHRLIWEKAYGPIPPGHNIVFLDGNKRNFALGNLACISKAENQQMTMKKMWYRDKALTASGIAIARIGVALTAAKKRKNDLKARRRNDSNK